MSVDSTRKKGSWHRSQHLECKNGNMSIQHAETGGWMKLRSFPNYPGSQRAVMILDSEMVEMLLDLIMQYDHEVHNDDDATDETVHLLPS